MIRILLLTIVALFGISLAHADGKKEKSREELFKEIQDFKMKYLADEMGIPDSQKQKFYDLYSEMTKRRRECMRTAKQLEKKLKKMDNPTEEDYQAATAAMNKAKEQDAAIEKEYADKFSTFLTQKQIYKMKEAEDSFRKKIEEMRKKKHKEKK